MSDYLIKVKKIIMVSWLDWEIFSSWCTLETFGKSVTFQYWKSVISVPRKNMQCHYPA